MWSRKGERVRYANPLVVIRVAGSRAAGLFKGFHDLLRLLRLMGLNSFPMDSHGFPFDSFDFPKDLILL